MGNYEISVEFLNCGKQQESHPGNNFIYFHLSRFFIHNRIIIIHQQLEEAD